MDPRNRFAVSADELDAARVDVEEQVEEQAEVRLHEAWGATTPHPFGDGATGADGDGD
ncbi:MAG TPA: hypothetical protein VNU26_09830 [Mycobacteriales bacterium]|nr:hypothetical protein [Mycobacteriales bacterium]